MFNTLTYECLSYPITERLPQCSWICGDFTPIQFSVSLSRTRHEGSTLRYVTEISKPFMLLPSRVALGRKRIPILLELVNATCLQQRINDVLDLLLPSSRLLPDHPRFGFWVGVQHKASLPPALKIYCNLLWQLGDPWSMFYDTLRLLDQTNLKSAFMNIQKSLGTYCQPSSVGLECTDDGFSKVKLYLRGYQLSWTNIHNFTKKLDWADFKNGFKLFHKIILSGRETYIPRSVVFSIGATRKPREFYDIKVEVGPNYYLKDDESVRRRIIELAHILMLDINPYEQMLHVFSNGALIPDTMCFHDVIGVGFNPQMGFRLNIYMRPDMLRYYKSR